MVTFTTTSHGMINQRRWALLGLLGGVAHADVCAWRWWLNDESQIVEVVVGG